jgi:hypothetical protein
MKSFIKNMLCSFILIGAVLVSQHMDQNDPFMYNNDLNTNNR